jgi:hypothetical protein
MGAMSSSSVRTAAGESPNSTSEGEREWFRKKRIIGALSGHSISRSQAREATLRSS